MGDGLGVGNVNFLIDVGQPGFAWNAHSEWGAIITAGGLLGAATLLGLYGTLLRRAFKRWTDFADYVPILVLVAALSTTPFHKLLSAPSILATGLLLVVVPETLSVRINDRDVSRRHVLG